MIRVLRNGLSPQELAFLEALKALLAGHHLVDVGVEFVESPAQEPNPLNKIFEDQLEFLKKKPKKKQ